ASPRHWAPQSPRVVGPKCATNRGGTRSAQNNGSKTGAALTDATTPFGKRTGIALAINARALQYRIPSGPPISTRTLKSKIAVAAESAATATQARIRPRTKAFIGIRHPGGRGAEASP